MVVMQDNTYLSVAGTGLQPDADFTLVSKVKKSSTSSAYDIILDTLAYRWGLYNQYLYTWKWGYKVFEAVSVTNEQWHTVVLRNQGGIVEQFVDGSSAGTYSI